MAQADGTYVANVASLTGGFKVMERPEYNGNGWRPIWFPSGNSVIALGEPIALTRSVGDDGPNITMPATWTSIDNAVCTFDPAAATITIDGTARMDALDLWIVGSMTGWSVTGTGNTIQMQTTDGNIYTAEINVVNNPTDPARFNIGKKGGWGDFGLPQDAPAVTAPSYGVQLTDTNRKDIALNVADGGYLVTFDLANMTMSLESTGVAPTPTYDDLFVTGSFTSWDTPGGAGTIKLTADADGVYTGIVNIYNSTSQPTRFQMGYYANWSCYGNLGSEPLTLPIIDADILAPGTEGASDIYINVPNGGYVFTFDQPNLKLSIEPYATDVDSKLAAMFTGNSITDFWDNTDPEFFAANRISDTGISGQVVTQIYERFDTEVLLEHPAIVVIIAPTTNDIAGNPGAVDHAGQIAVVSQMIDKAEAVGARVVLTSNLPCNYFFWQPAMRPGAEIIEVNAMLESLAQQKGIVYVDLHTPLTDAEGGLPATYSGDGAHPNAAGYEVMKSILLPVVNEVRADIIKMSVIEGVGADNSEAVYYNIHGCRVANPTNGLYIRRQGVKTTKVVL